MQKKSTNYHSNIYSVLKTGIYLAPMLLSNIDVYAAIDLDAGMKAATEPVKKMINDYYPVVFL
ncbi:MAG: hypothetical protein ACE1S7_00490 [Candidatus Tisiphia sp.]